MKRPLDRVLVIEDEPAVADVLAYGLQVAGANEVLVAHDGSTGVAMARQHTPDLVLLDLMLPGLDGLEVCRLLRSSDPPIRSPIIFVTAAGIAFQHRGPRSYGANGAIIKPVDVRRLGEQIDAILSQGGEE